MGPGDTRARPSVNPEMVPVYVLRDEVERMLIEAALAREGIWYFIQSRGFGSLYPGVQVPALNERQIHTARSQAPQAVETIREVVEELDATRDSPFTGVTKMRMVAETLVFGWFVPGVRANE